MTLSRLSTVLPLTPTCTSHLNAPAPSFTAPCLAPTVWTPRLQLTNLHTVVRVKGLIYTTGLPAHSTAPISQLADTGANCCLCQDESIPVGVHSITPVPIGVATAPENKTNVTYCNRMGYLPLTRTDNTTHMQPFYCTPKASGVIMYPECVMTMSPTSLNGFKQDIEIRTSPVTLCSRIRMRVWS